MRLASGCTVIIQIARRDKTICYSSIISNASRSYDCNEIRYNDPYRYQTAISCLRNNITALETRILWKVSGQTPLQLRTAVQDGRQRFLVVGNVVGEEGD
jgi:hypothetical protein